MTTWPLSLTALGLAAIMSLANLAAAQSTRANVDPPAALFQRHCAICHDNPATRAPSSTSLHAMSATFIVNALTSGIMQGPGAGLLPEQRVAIAEYLTDKKLADVAPMAGRCAGTSSALKWDRSSYNGWGANAENWRYQNEPGFSAADLNRLEVKWAFGFPGAVAMFGQPTVVAGRVFVGSQNGHVYSIDAALGCYYWDYTAVTGVRTAISVARLGNSDVALFGDRRGNVYSVDAMTGKLGWRVTPDKDPRTGITGAPALFDGALYIPVSGGDDSSAADPKFECCKGRGAVIALDAATGRTRWITYTIPDARPLGKNRIGTQLWGPSGASIWSSPTIDRQRRLLYVGTGDNHSAPATDSSDAVIALSLDSGKIVWTRQLLQGDMGNAACLSTDTDNCPQPHGPDYDLGASPNLITLASGKRLLTIGQKSGVIWALDPDDRGRIVWNTRVGAGGPLGGVQWGTATDGKFVYAAVSDLTFTSLILGQPLVPNPNIGGGLYALNLDSGVIAWTAPPARACAGRKNCSPAQSAAVTATAEFALSGSVDGHIRAYATADGVLLWDYDTVKPFTTVNGVKANGGSLDAGGATVAGGMLFVNSGYGLYGGEAGNVLIAFGLR
jgi:polyvinyl alcohol dehydrogenase (cytochrome)